jgi:predicted lipoprotein with Yx(FWY)xxD motif
MRAPKTLLLGAVLLAGMAACGGQSHPSAHHAAAVPVDNTVRVQIHQSSLGPILTDQDGRTLYAFTNDKNGASSCTGECIATWPALVSKQPAQAGTGTESTLLAQSTRAEGTAQATYNNWPLYYYAGDTGPGDVDGQGVDGVWFVLGSDGKLVK